MTAKLVGGRYEIIKLIAEGGMGAVYEAVHTLSKKRVALKVLFPHICKNDDSRQRFLREVSAPAQIGHDGIVEVYDAGIDTSDGTLFVAMELLIGETVRDWMLRPHRHEEVLALFAEILEPLAAAHAKGIVHRDLKPENVFLQTQKDGSQKVKILDFGIARDLDQSDTNLTQTGIAMGTPHYMAPEQAMSARGVTATADVWALGVMLFEALSGRTPFAGETASAIVVHACTQPHPPLGSVAPSVPPAIAALVDQCLAKKPEQRPADAAAMSAAIKQTGGGGAAWGRAGAVPQRGANQTGPAGFGQPAQAFGQPAQPQGQPSSAQTPQSGFGQPAQAAFGHAQGHGQAGQAPGQFGQPQSSPGFGQSPQPTPPGYGGPVQTAHPHQAGPPQSGGGKGLLIMGVLGVGALLLGGLGVGAVALFSGSDSGHLQLTTDITGGELFVDGASHGLVSTGQLVDVPPGTHTVEMRVGNAPVASEMVSVTEGNTTQVALIRPVATPPPQQQQPQQQQQGPSALDQYHASHPFTATRHRERRRTERGHLEGGDQTLNSGEFADYYTYTWTAGSQVRVEVSSSTLDPYVIVRTPAGPQYDNDDISSEDHNARLDIDVRETGTFTVIATTYRPGESGRYRMTVRPR